MPASDMSPQRRAEVQRIMDGIARRLLDEQLAEQGLPPGQVPAAEPIRPQAEPRKPIVEAPASILEPWLDKQGLAAHLGCSVRWVEGRQAEGMPHAIIAGRIKFRVSEVEPWLEAKGHLERRGDVPDC